MAKFGDKKLIYQIYKKPLIRWCIKLNRFIHCCTACWGVHFGSESINLNHLIEVPLYQRICWVKENKCCFCLVSFGSVSLCLGGMWSQNWQLYRNLIMPFDEFSMDKQMKTLNWTAIDMVKKADDFYRSLSLPAMTNEFWEHSIFVKSNDFNNCHGTAANMFEKDDFR